MGKSFFLSDELHDYLLSATTPLDEVLRDLQRETATLGGVAGMQIAPEQGAFLTILAASMGARRAVEVGTFTGYSSLCVARGMGPEGRLTCFDVSDEWTSIARRYWERAGVASRIDLVLGPAVKSLEAFDPAVALDLAFIDADKESYPQYVELLLRRLRTGGLLLLDNTLRAGDVLPSRASADETTAVIVRLNAALAHDPRVDVVLLPVADGLTIARKR